MVVILRERVSVKTFFLYTADIGILEKVFNETWIFLGQTCDVFGNPPLVSFLVFK